MNEQPARPVDVIADALAELPFPEWNSFPAAPPPPPVFTVLGIYEEMRERHRGTWYGRQLDYAVGRVRDEWAA